MGFRIQKLKFILGVLFILLSIQVSVPANESLHIAGMGGAFAGLRSVEGGIFGNPAGLIDIHNNNLSISLSTRNLDYEELPLAEDEQLNTRFALRLSPSIYYSRVIGGVGIGLGYVDDADSSNVVKIMATKAGYLVDERE